MPDTLFEKEKSALGRLFKLVRDRAAGEAAVAAAFRDAADDAEREVQKARRQVAAARNKARSEIDEAYQQAVADLGAKYAGMQTATVKKRADAVRAAEDKFAAATEKAKAEYQERLWTLDSLLEAGEKEAEDHRLKLRRQAEQARKQVEATWARVEPGLHRVGLDRDDVAFRADRLPPPTDTDPEGKLEKCLE